MKTKFIWFILPFLYIQTACLDDKGNYDYMITGDEVTILFDESFEPIKVGEEITLEPELIFNLPNDDVTNYEHEWYLNAKLVSNDPKITLLGEKVENLIFTYALKHKKSGYSYIEDGLLVKVNPLYTNGWIILYEKEGKSELATIMPDGQGGYTNITGLYEKHNEKPLGTKPVFLKPYLVSPSVSNQMAGLFVGQNGGEGSIEVNSHDFNKIMSLSDQFVGEIPSSLKPIDIAFSQRTHFLLSENGDVYRRFLMNSSSEIVWSAPWNSSPEQIDGGMKIKDLWDCYGRRTMFIMMYDDLNKRVIVFAPGGSSPSGERALMPLPAPQGGYPTDRKYYPLHDLGNIEYVWGGVFGDGVFSTLYTARGAIVFKDLDESKMYYQDFDFVADRLITTPKKCIEFPEEYLSSTSKFDPVKSRDYLFFSGGQSNQELYHYDVTSGITKLYTTLEAPVSVISSDINGNILFVGLENGSVHLFDISHEVIASGESKELYNMGGLGKVIDIVSKTKENF